MHSPTDHFERWTPDDDFRAKFNALCRYHECSFEKLCHASGIDSNTARRAIEMGTDGLPGTETILLRLLQPFDLDISWLISGTVPFGSTFDKDRLRIFELIYEFCLRNEVPKLHRSALFKEIMPLMHPMRPAITSKAAKTQRIPRTMQDVAYIYRELFPDKSKRSR